MFLIILQQQGKVKPYQIKCQNYEKALICESWKFYISSESKFVKFLADFSALLHLISASMKWIEFAKWSIEVKKKGRYETY